MSRNTARKEKQEKQGRLLGNAKLFALQVHSKRIKEINTHTSTQKENFTLRSYCHLQSCFSKFN